MSEIYRRYNPSQQINQIKHQSQHQTSPSKQQGVHQQSVQQKSQQQTVSPKTSIEKPSPANCPFPSASSQSKNHGNPSQNNQPQNAKTPHSDVNKNAVNFLHNLIPKTIYNPDSKKILGFLSCEDLLLIALIFLFIENTEEDSSMMVLALLYVLLSEYVDFGEFSF